jgi:hypothetical protein
MSSRRCAVEVKLHSSAMLVRFSKEREIPGMFIEPMNGPLKIRLGTIPRASDTDQYLYGPRRESGHTELCQRLVCYCAHLERTHAPLIVDQQYQLVPLLELDVGPFWVVLVKQQIQQLRNELLGARLGDIEYALMISAFASSRCNTVSLWRPNPISTRPSGICQSPERPGTWQ